MANLSWKCPLVTPLRGTDSHPIMRKGSQMFRASITSTQMKNWLSCIAQPLLQRLLRLQAGPQITRPSTCLGIIKAYWMLWGLKIYRTSWKSFRPSKTSSLLRQMPNVSKTTLETPSTGLLLSTTSNSKPQKRLRSRVIQEQTTIPLTTLKVLPISKDSFKGSKSSSS